MRKYCLAHDLDCYADHDTWHAATPLTVESHQLQQCIEDFKLVAYAAADLVPSLAARGLGAVHAVGYEDP